MGNVIPLRRAASIVQCTRVHATEDLMVAHLRWWFAAVRDINRFWWGA